MHDPEDAQQLSRAVFRLARAHKSLAARLLRASGLRPGQELVLMSLWEDGPQRQVDLVEALDSDAGTMARSIARLERAGLVERTRSPSDGRAMIVSITESGLALRPQVEAAWAELDRVTTGSLSPHRVSQIVDGMAELERNLAASD